MARTTTTARTTTARTTTARPARVAKPLPTIVRTATGELLLTGLPFFVEGVGRTNRIMGAKGLGWEWDGDVKGWRTGDAGAAAVCVEEWSDHGVMIDVLDDAPAKAPARPAKAAAKAPARPAKAATKAPATTDGGSLAEIITAALAGVHAEIITGAIAGATMAASAVAKAAAKAPARPAKAPAKAAAKAPARPAKAPALAGIDKITTDADGARRYALLRTVAPRAAGKAVRQALAADKRNEGACAGADWHVTVDRTDRAIMVYRVADDARPAGTEIDAIIAGAVATLA